MYNSDDEMSDYDNSNSFRTREYKIYKKVKRKKKLMRKDLIQIGMMT